MKPHFNFVEIIFRDIDKILTEISYAVSKQRFRKR